MKRNVDEQRLDIFEERCVVSSPSDRHRNGRPLSNTGESPLRLELAMQLIAEPPAHEDKVPMTAAQATELLRQLSHETRFLRQCMGGLFAVAGARRAENLRFTQDSLDDAARLFEVLARLAEAD